MGEEQYSILLLGNFAVRRNQRTIKLSLRRKPRALLAYLIVTKRPHSRRSLANLFCQETKDPMGALRSLLSRIRRQFDSEMLITEGDTVEFNREAAWVDYYEFCGVFDGDWVQQSTAALEAAVDLCRGELLDGLSLTGAPEFDLWLLGERTRLSRIYEQGLSSTLYKSSQNSKGRISCDQTTTRGHKCLFYLNQL